MATVNLRVGQKVVCTGNWPKHTLWSYIKENWLFPFKAPKTNEVYTISNIYWSDKYLIVELLELPSPETKHYCAGFYAQAFKPIVETDISVFTAMLKSKKKEYQI